MLKLTDDAVQRLIRQIIAKMQGGRVDLLDAEGSILASFPFPPKERVQVIGKTATCLDKLMTDAVGSGEAASVLFVGAGDEPVLRGDVGEQSSSAFLRMDNTHLLKGGAVEIVSATVEVR